MRFRASPVLMEFRKSTENNEEDNCEHYNRQRVRVLAQETKVPVIAFDALHIGVSHGKGMDISEDYFWGLARRLDLAVGAPILLIQNLAIKLGLINGSQGFIKIISYLPGHHPNHDDVNCRMPYTIVVDSPAYIGPRFFPDAGCATWVPLLPRECKHTEDRSVARTQFPICLAWAITPWKAQGVTLAMVILK